MKNRAKTYYQYINEAHVDQYGELHDFTPPGKDDTEYRTVEEIQKIKDFIEDEGADLHSTSYNNGIIRVGFEYFGAEYLLILDLDQDIAEIRAFTRKGERVEVYTGAMGELFDVFSANGLKFLR